MKKKRCLIFGANGFIARSFANNLKIKDRFNIIKFPKKKLNLLNKNCILLLNKFIKKGDYILFLAAEAPCKNLDQLEKNVKMITNFLSVIKNKDISYLSYVSSDAVYSDTLKKINENSLTNVDNFHGVMHKIREDLIKKFYKGKLSIFRPTLIFGPDDPHNGYGPNQFIRLILNRKSINLIGKGEERRDHIHIDSVVSVISEAFLKQKKGIYNIASGKVFSFYDLAKKICLVLSKSGHIKMTKRVGSLHHLGLRRFNILKLKKNFKNIKLIDIMNYIDSYNLREYNNIK